LQAAKFHKKNYRISRLPGSLTHKGPPLSLRVVSPPFNPLSSKPLLRTQKIKDNRRLIHIPAQSLRGNNPFPSSILKNGTLTTRRTFTFLQYPTLSLVSFFLTPPHNQLRMLKRDTGVVPALVFSRTWFSVLSSSSCAYSRDLRIR
jgi:hypothetical protein